MKAILSILALAIALLATPVFAEECPLHEWINVTNFRIVNDGADIVVSADLSVVDDSGRNPADYYGCRTHNELAWRFEGSFSHESGDPQTPTVFAFNSECGDSIELGPYDYSPPSKYPLTLTATKFEFRFPGKAIGPSLHFDYTGIFLDVPTGPLDGCWIAFRGTFERIDSTPVRRASWGTVKSYYR